MYRLIKIKSLNSHYLFTSPKNKHKQIGSRSRFASFFFPTISAVHRFFSFTPTPNLRTKRRRLPLPSPMFTGCSARRSRFTTPSVEKKRALTGESEAVSKNTKAVEVQSAQDKMLLPNKDKLQGSISIVAERVQDRGGGQGQNSVY